MTTRDSEHKLLFSEIQALSGVGSFDWNLKTNELYWSNHLFALYGLEPQEEPIKVEDFISRLHPEDRDAVWQAVQTAVNETGSLQREERIIRADGAIRLLESRGIVIRDESGEAIRFLGTCRDITDQRETDRALKWQIESLDLLSEVSKELLAEAPTPEDSLGVLGRLASHLGCNIFAQYRVDGTQMVLSAHGGLDAEMTAALSRFSVGEYPCGLCAETRDFIHLEGDKLLETASAALLVKKGVRCFICGPLLKAGNVIGIASFASSTRESFSSCELDFVRAAIDVLAVAEARHRADEELRASEARCQLVVEHAKIVIWEADRQMERFSYVTGSGEALLGFNESQWHEAGFWKRQIHSSDRSSAVNACRKAAESRKDFRQEYRMVHANGNTIWVEHVGHVSEEHGEVVGLRGALVDITDRKSLESQYLQAQKMEAVGTLTGGIAHDFNNLLTAVIGNLESAEHVGRQHPEHVEVKAMLEHVEGAHEAAQRGAATVRHLLTFSRKDSVEQTPVNFNEVVRSAIKFLSHAIDASIRMQVNLSEASTTVLGNAAQLEHLIFNLCTNSKDAMPHGGEISLSTERVSDSDGEKVVLRVQDTGIGMDESMLARMFEPFYTTKTLDKGSGLGLAMCYAVVQQHGGTIRCQSSVGEGTEFQIELPALKPSEAPVVVKPPSAHANENSGSIRVLIVDDEKMVLMATSGLLEHHGFETVQAQSGNEALQLIQNLEADPIDVVLLDRTMPDLDGWATLREIRRLHPELPVVLCSGYLNNEEFDVEGPQPAAMLQKPYKATELTAVLRDAVRL